MKKILLLSLLLMNVTWLSAADKPLAMTKAQARQFCEKWLPHWVGGEEAVEDLLPFYSEDTVYEDPNVPKLEGNPKELKGKAALGGYLKILLKKYPDWKFNISAVYPTEKGFILQYVGMVPQAGAKTIENFRGIDIIELDANGKISKQLGYFDRHVFFE